MRIAVCVKQVVSREWHLRVADSRTWIHDAEASYELNEPDAYALEAGLRLREQHGGEVVVISAGPARVVQVIREALARGADRAIHVEADGLTEADPAAAAGAIAVALGEERCDLVLTGLQADDTGFAQTGVVLAERLGMPHSSIIVEVQVTDGGLRVKRELEGGWFQWIAMPLPAVLTIQTGVSQLRYATLKGIMAAKKKEVKGVVVPACDPTCETVNLYVPAKVKTTKLIEGTPVDAAKQLVRLLRDEARVLEP
jgi:electron transfer flavoprotein beta subunit